MSTSEVETRALSMGWLPKERFHGDETKWVDAETFVSRGETFVPYLKANNRKLEAKVESLSQQLTQLAKTSQEQINALLEYNSEINKERVENQRKDLVAGIKAARDSGDVETEEKLRERLSDTKAALAKADELKTKKVDTTQPAVVPSPEVKAAFEGFVSTHPWYEEDHMMKSAFIGMMQTSMLDPNFKKENPTPELQFEAVAQMVEKRFGQSPRGSASRSKYESGGGGNGPEAPRGEKAKGYAELPDEAKAGCERYASKLVGKDKTYKKIEDWQAKFAADYWRNNPNG